jgi:hypothetical protein
MTQTPAARLDVWPPLPLEAWSDTCMTLHMWTRICHAIRDLLYNHLSQTGEARVSLRSTGV